MFMTTKNGKAIARIIAIAICAFMLIAVGASCSDEAAVRAEEALNAALQAEQAAKDANQAAKDAQDSADQALDEAEKAEDAANEKLTEAELVALLEKYVDSDELAAELAKLITEESVKALVSGDITKATDEVMAKVNKLLEEYGCTELSKISEKIEKIAKDVVTEYANSLDASADEALDALLALIETKNKKLAEIKLSLKYGDAADAAVREAFEIAQVEILCAKNAAEISAANAKFAAVLADLPNIVDELNARADALTGKVIIAVPGIYADTSLDEIAALETIVNLVNNDATLADLKAEMNAGDDSIADKVVALRADYTALETALAAAADANTKINGLAPYNTLKYADVVADDTGLVDRVAAAKTAVETWLNTYFANDRDNVNIARILYNAAAYLKDDTATGVEADFANVDSPAEYAEYVANLPAKYLAAFAAALAETNWDEAYVLASDYANVNTLYVAFLAEEAKFEFKVAGDIETEAADYADAWNYAAYANYLSELYNAENSTVKAAVDALVALNGKLSINDVVATENNKFTAFNNAIIAWANTDEPTDATFSEVVVVEEVLAEILGEDNVDAYEALAARKAVLLAAKDAAAAINNGGTYTYGDGVNAVVFDGKSGLVQFFDVAENVWTLKTTIIYRDIVELRRLETLRNLWIETFEIAVPGEEAEQYVLDNYNLVKNAELKTALDAAKVLVDAIVNAETSKALTAAIADINKVSNNGADYGNLYAYVLIQKAFDAYYAWEAEFELDALDTTGIEEFKAANLDNVFGNLSIALERAKVVYDEADAAFDATLYTEFGANFTVENYEPTIYDAFVREAWANAKAWVETYLNENADFGSDEALYNIDDLNLLTSDVYAKVKGAYEKYDAYVVAAFNELKAIDDKVAAFKNGDEFTKINLITDKKATTVDIPAEFAVWQTKYIDTTATTAADTRLTYTATATSVAALKAAYETLATNAANAWTANVAGKIAALENYDAKIYSSADENEALNQARTAYNTWASNYLAGVADNTKSAAFANMPADDTQLAAYKAAIVAIEELEAETAELVKAYEDERAAIIAEINKLPATITSADKANVETIRTRYNTWAAQLSTLEDTNVVFNTDAIKTAVATLKAAEKKLDDIKKAYGDVVDALETLPPAPQDIVVDDIADLAVGGTFDTAASAYAAAVEALEDLVDAYLALNGMDAVAAGTVAGYDLTAEQAKAITAAYNLADSAAAVKKAHSLFFEYQNELANLNYTPEEKADREQALTTTKNVLINNIVADAENGTATTEGKVERVGRVRMAAILSASGTTAEPELDDTWEDLENWGPTGLI